MIKINIPKIKYYKITNENECHHGFQYYDGLNVDHNPFQEYGSCVSGGLYFTTAKDILNFIKYGIYVRDITLPWEDTELKVVKDSYGDKYRANKIILGKKYHLSDPKTFDFLIDQGAKIKKSNFDSILDWAITNDYVEIVKYLITTYHHLIAKYNLREILNWAIKYGHTKIIDFLISGYQEITKQNLKTILKWAIKHNYTKVINHLLTKYSEIIVPDSNMYNENIAKFVSRINRRDIFIKSTLTTIYGLFLVYLFGKK